MWQFGIKISTIIRIRGIFYTSSIFYEFYYKYCNKIRPVREEDEMQSYLPEGCLVDSYENKYYISSLATLEEAMEQKQILEARSILCDSSRNLIVDLGFCKAVIPKNEGALGIESGQTKEIAIISKVNKPVCFVVTGFQTNDEKGVTPILSRRLAQSLCRDNFHTQLKPGDIIKGKVTHLETFGVFVDIGCGVASLLPIDQISISRISHPSDRFSVGDDIMVVVKSFDDSGRVCLSHKELLGTWEENIALFTTGETVAGIIRSVEDYGVFVELTPNLAGLAEPFAGAAVGKYASVYIKNIIPERMKIKLVLVDAFSAQYAPAPLQYFINSGSIEHWRYSPDLCQKLIESKF